MTALSQQSWQHIFTRRSLVLWQRQPDICEKGEGMCHMCCCSTYPSRKMRWNSHMGNIMLVFLAALSLCRKKKNKQHRLLCK